MHKIKLVDISGIGHSGKTACSDLLKEVDFIYSHPSSFEFNLLRLKDGIIDLKYSIEENWSPIRSDFAIKKFQILVENLNRNYSNSLNINLKKLTDEFINNLVIGILYSNWYDELYDRKKKSYIPKIIKSSLKQILKSIGYKYGDTSKRNKVYLVQNSNFKYELKKYLNNVLFENLKNTNYKYLITHNAFEPFKPNKSLELFDNAFSIIIIRDPRDIYLSTLDENEIFNPNFESKNPVYSLEYLSQLKKDFLGTNNIELFIKRQKIYWLNISQTKNDKCLKIYFEDLILNYDFTKKKVFDFLKINNDNHTKMNKYFNPELSKKNIFLWKNSNRISELNLIEKELGKYFYNYEKK